MVEKGWPMDPAMSTENILDLLYSIIKYARTLTPVSYHPVI